MIKKRDFTSRFTREDELKIAAYTEKVKYADLVEDIKFREIAKSKEAVEEILRVVLKDEKLVVVRSIEQKNIAESVFHGVILDCECELKTGELVNIEMQIAFKNAPVKRMRYNQSAMTIAHSPKNKYFDYEKLPSIISIMFCEFDIFGLRDPIYEIKRHVNDTSKISDNGIRELYVNLTAEVEDKKLKELFDILKVLTYMNNQMFPNLSKTKEKFNNMMEGDKFMSGLTREIYIDGYETGEKRGVQQGIEQGKLSLLMNLVRDKLISVAEAAKRLGVSESDFLKLAK